MPLPTPPLPRGKVRIGDEDVEIRAMTRAEIVRVRKIIGSEADAEVLILSCGMDTPEDEIRVWYDAVSAGVVRDVISAIRSLSGLDEEASKSP